MITECYKLLDLMQLFKLQTLKFCSFLDGSGGAETVVVPTLTTLLVAMVTCVVVTVLICTVVIRRNR